MAKVVRSGNMFFKDDIKIIDAEIDCPLNLPTPPIFSADELQIFYNGHIFLTSENPNKNRQIKVYTMLLGLKETDSPKSQEDKYFADNQQTIKKLKEDFIEKVINGISILDETFTSKRIPTQISSELVKRIEEPYSSKRIKKPNPKNYVGKDLITRLDDGSVFNSQMTGCERTLLLDGKVYDLEALSEFVSKFERSIEKAFYQQLKKACESETPEQISKILLDNKDKVHRKVFPMVRNKIWHSNRSSKLFLDGTYWIPEHNAADDYAKLYEKLLERKMKVEAVGGYLK